MGEKEVWFVDFSCMNQGLLDYSIVPRPHPRGEEKGSGYNTTSHPTLEGRNQIPVINCK